MQFDLPFNTQDQASKELTAVARGARQAAPAPKGGIGRPGAPGAPGASAATRPAGSAKPWTLPQRGMAVFYGPGNTPRLSHYFLPRLLLEGKRVLLLDGANSADPRLLARLARERSVPFERFSRRVELARAFTCFQLTELIARVPRFLASFPAEILMVTALPELYFDEDVRDWEARVAFEQALGHLRRSLLRRLSVAVFTAPETFTPSAARRNFLAKVQAAATEVWHFRRGDDGRPRLICERCSKSLREVRHGTNPRDLPRTG